MIRSRSLPEPAPRRDRFYLISRRILTSAVPAARREIEIARVFAGQVKGRATRNILMIDDNEDESVKSLAEHAFELGGYGWDVI